MVKPSLAYSVAMGLVFVGLCLGLIAVQLVPGPLQPDGWPALDVILCVTLAWVARRPEQVPVLLIALTLLTADLLLQAPPGLGAALGLIASEIVRRRVLQSGPLFFFPEFWRIAVLIAAVGVAQWLVLGLALTPRPSLGDVLLRSALSAALYPAVVLGLRALGVRRLTPISGSLPKRRVQA